MVAAAAQDDASCTCTCQEVPLPARLSKLCPLRWSLACLACCLRACARVQAIVADGLYHPAINESIALRMSVTEPPAKYPTADLRAEVRHGR